MFKPKHTLESVVLDLVKGLESGDIVLDSAPKEDVYRAALAAAKAHDRDKSTELFQHYLRLSESDGDHRGEWRALSRLGWLSVRQDSARAIDYLQRALATARRLKDARMEAQSLYNLACAYAVSDDQQATGYLHHALDAMRKEPSVQIDAGELIKDLETVS